MEQDLGIPEGEIRDFLTEAQKALRSKRLKTQYGKDRSYHWFYVELQADDKVFPTVVTLEVRRVGGRLMST